MQIINKPVTVEYAHFRYNKDFSRLQQTKKYDLEDREILSPFGGVTIAYVKTKHGINFGIAVCSSKDQYIKSVGRLVALSRLGQNELIELNRMNSYHHFSISEFIAHLMFENT